MTAPHEFKVRVYLEDTDAGGIVYYANYLRFMERARTEMLKDTGVDHAAMIDDGSMFVVRRCTVDYHKPARLADDLIVQSVIHETGAASLVMYQKVIKNGTVLVSGEIQLACIDKAGGVRRIPAAILAKIGGVG